MATSLLMKVAALAVALAACRPHDVAAPRTLAGAEDGDAVLAVYLSSATAGPGTSAQIGPDGEALYLASAPLVTAAHVVKATRSTATDGRPAIVLELSDDGARILSDRSPDYVDRTLAFVSRGRVVFAPQVKSALSRRLMVVGGTPALPAEAVDGLIDELNARSRGDGSP